jgi:[acyl-carrier-protein] S-malonyltransferase
MFNYLRGLPGCADIFDVAEERMGEGFLDEIHEGSSMLYANHFVQPLICLSTLAWWHLLRELLPAPSLILGYSVGEIAAHSCSGIFSVGETLDLAGLRAELMDVAAREHPGALLALRGLRWSRLEPLVDLHSVELAIGAGADHFILGGRRERLEALRVSALTSGAGHARWLPGSVATHTSLMEPARAAFHGALWNCVYKKVTWPRNAPVVLAGIDASPVLDQAALVQTLSDQLVRTVEWVACLDAAWESGARVFLEVGAGDTLSKTVREWDAEAIVRSVEEFPNAEAVTEWVNSQLAQLDANAESGN